MAERLLYQANHKQDIATLRLEIERLTACYEGAKLVIQSRDMLLERIACGETPKQDVILRLIRSDENQKHQALRCDHGYELCRETVLEIDQLRDAISIVLLALEGETAGHLMSARSVLQHALKAKP